MLKHWNLCFIVVLVQNVLGQITQAVPDVLDVQNAKFMYTSSSVLTASIFPIQGDGFDLDGLISETKKMSSNTGNEISVVLSVMQTVIGQTGAKNVQNCLKAVESTNTIALVDCNSKPTVWNMSINNDQTVTISYKSSSSSNSVSFLGTSTKLSEGKNDVPLTIIKTPSYSLWALHHQELGYVFFFVFRGSKTSSGPNSNASNSVNCQGNGSLLQYFQNGEIKGKCTKSDEDLVKAKSAYVFHSSKRCLAPVSQFPPSQNVNYFLIHVYCGKNGSELDTVAWKIASKGDRKYEVSIGTSGKDFCLGNNFILIDKKGDCPLHELKEKDGAWVLDDSKDITLVPIL
ncbi:hypothetical protein O9G_004038 [Rozella allomycis CSF55]|uniref:Uncharacterized protein n=1 Tax=Rozella allomycis (strain CSF55) TaxID=988480 RepID=A0A075B0R5_ROZAC|nr:hypothetical protein O9G_004038 [Rozella allomycis CSF55]|eukprot:EPZ36134.1 hypothetical protein O9G_004038 [Rozella allomycis CSF55]